MTARLAVLIAVVVAGAILGHLGRRITRRHSSAAEAAPSLAPGLWLVTAPYCHRCRQLRDRLDALEPHIAYQTFDVTEEPDLVRVLDIRSAPTLLAVDNAGQVRGRLQGDFSGVDLDHIVGLVRAPAT